MNASTALHYTITPDPHRHVFHMTLLIRDSHSEGVTFFMPNWIAGSYMMRDFARHIVSISATDHDGNPVELTPLNQFSWRSAAFEGSLTVSYEVFAHDPSVRTAFLDTRTGFFNATSLCLSVEECSQHPHRLTLNAPKGFEYWQVATQLTRIASTPEHGFGAYSAANYDELADRPVRMGQLTWLHFSACGIPHSIAISGEWSHLAAQRLSNDVQAICTAQLRLFEPKIQQTEVKPFESYLFMLDVRQSAYGGLEHRDSTALLCSRDSLPTVLDGQERRKPYIELLGLISHEYFHSWNVKRIKPANFVPYDLTQPTDTSLLWFFEGVTSYYDDLILLRTGILTQQQYLDLLNKNINAVLRHSAHRRQTVVDAGFYAWTKYYQPSENSINANISYYTKGALIALCLDLFIRYNSRERYSLDDVMRELWQKFGQNFYQPNAEQHGVTLADIERTIDQFAGASAYDLLYVALFTTKPLPLNLLLLTQGLHLKYKTPKTVELGAALKKVDDGWLVERVASGSWAERSGIAPQDVLIALNRFKLEKKPDELFEQHPANALLELTFWRDGVLHNSSISNRVLKSQIGQFQIEPSSPTLKSSQWPNSNTLSPSFAEGILTNYAASR